jgi:hypothetical protein
VSYKAYLDNIKEKTGKGPEAYAALARRKGLTTHAELLAWLKSDMGLGHGHANALILYIREPRIAKAKLTADAAKEKAAAKRKK